MAVLEPGVLPGCVELSPCPGDGVTRVQFGGEAASRLLVSTWSGTVCIHTSDTGHLLCEANPAHAALLDATWTHPSYAVAVGALDGSVRYSPMATGGFGEWSTLHTHESAVKALVECDERKCLVSGGWDGMLKVLDVRQQKNHLMEKVSVGGKVYGANAYGPECVVVITSERRVRILDLRKVNDFVHDKMPQALTYQLRGISANKGGTRYVVGSTEGRVAVDWPDHPKRGYSFRCHRLDGLAFPINTIAHNDKYNSFATGGGDGHVSLWDADGRKRIAQYVRQATSIASLHFNHDSSKLAVAVSYTFEEGEKDHPPDAVHIRPVVDADISVALPQPTPTT